MPEPTSKYDRVTTAVLLRHQAKVARSKGQAYITIAVTKAEAIADELERIDAARVQ